MFDTRDGTTEGHSTPIISATMSKDLALNSVPLEPSVHTVNQESITPTSNAEGTTPADEFQYEDVEFDIDSLKDQLGIREILESLSTLSRNVSGQQKPVRRFQNLELQVACPTQVLILRLQF